ncbi:MAG: YbaK/EbsC family protein [Acidimicrobiia bacterium]|nr:YbaK/EbsC family protein [Acidimicrobiia bacterium]
MASPSVERVTNAAAAAGLVLEIVEYPDGTRSAEAAAAAVGCDVAQIVKSMIFDTDTGLVLALTSGTHLVDTDKLALLIGVGSCGRADADRVRSVTGFAIGGVAPFGHRSRIRAVMDPHLLRFDRVWAAAGTPRHVFPIQPDVLQNIAQATLGDFTRTG